MISILAVRRIEDPAAANDIVGSALAATAQARCQVLVLAPGPLVAEDEEEALQIAQMVHLRARLRDLVAIVGVVVRGDPSWPPLLEITAPVLFRCGSGAPGPERLHPWACVAVPGGEVVVLSPRAAFDPRLRRWVSDRRSDLALVLGSQRITDRWRPMLEAWDREVPIVAIGRTVQIGSQRSRAALSLRPTVAHDGLEAWLLQSEPSASETSTETVESASPAPGILTTAARR